MVDESNSTTWYQGDLRRSLVTLALLCIGIVAVYWPQMTAPLLGSQASSGSYFVYHTDLDFWRQTQRARTITAISHFDLDHDLNNIPLQVGDWQGETKPETNQEVMILLEPEQYVLRLYQNSAGHYIWLSMIGGRNSQAFHPPDVCYDADGWQYNFGSHPIVLDEGGEVYGFYLEAQKTVPHQPKPSEHVVYYFYLFPNENRNLSEGIVLFKLTSGRYGSLEETLEIQADFVRKFFKSASN